MKRIDLRYGTDRNRLLVLRTMVTWAFYPTGGLMPAWARVNNSKLIEAIYA